MPTTPEAAIKALARLPPNTTCPNCGTHNKYGFSTICIKYLTFVCNDCKSSHQAISHRCKSLTMSSWDHGEVLQLKTHGNEYARRVWLGNAPPPGSGGRPKEGDDINVFKRFVVEAYENKRYYVEPVVGEDYSGGQVNARVHRPATGRTITSHKPNVALEQNAFPVASAPMVPPQQPVRSAPVPVSAPAPAVAAPAVDLLDFGAFDSAPLSSNAPPPNAQFGQPATNAPPAGDLFDPFNTNPLASAPAAPPAPPAAPMQMNTTNNAFGGNASFDPFGTMGFTTSQPAPAQTMTNQPAKVPVMNSFNGMSNSPMNGMTNGGMNNNIMNNGMMNGGMNNMMNNPMMQHQMQQNAFGMGGGMPANNMGMVNNNLGMMNGMGTTNMMGNNMMMNGMGTPMGTPMGGGQKTLSSTPQPAMNMNIMQPMNNQISNNFSSSPKKAEANKSDPFAGLGF